MTDAPLEACAAEIVELHRFFTDWFHGDLPDTEVAWSRVTKVLAPTFTLVSPDGLALEREPLLEAIRARHGSHGPARDFDIWTRNVTSRYTDERLLLVTYEEWQRREGEEIGRLSTALFERDAHAPHGVRWLHVHETWLPKAN